MSQAPTYPADGDFLLSLSPLTVVVPVKSLLSLLLILQVVVAQQQWTTWIHQEKHFESQTVTGFVDVPRVSKPLSRLPRHA